MFLLKLSFEIADRCLKAGKVPYAFVRVLPKEPLLTEFKLLNQYETGEVGDVHEYDEVERHV